MIRKFLTRQAVNYIERHLHDKDGDSWHIINEAERARIRKVRIRSYMMAAFVGAFFVVTLYLPVYLWPDSWFTHETHIDLWGYYDFDFNVNFLLYSFAILPPEIWALRLINLWATARICDTFGVKPYSEQHHTELEDVASLALERKDKRLRKFGINPYIGVPLTYIILVNIWVNFRQTLSNMAFKTLVRFGVGTESSSSIVDFSGIPVFMVWNSVTTNTAIKNVIRRMMTHSVVKEIHARIDLSEDHLQRLTFLCIYYTSNIKRSYHPNHLVMLTGLLQDVKDSTRLEKWASEYDADRMVDEMLALDASEREWLEKVILMGMFVDGHISFRERKHIDYLSEKGILTLSGNEASKWCKDFIDGKFDVLAFLKSIHEKEISA